MLLPEHFFTQCRKRINALWKFAFLSTFFIGFFTHLFRLTNYLLTWDSLFNFYSDQNTIRLGRSFLTYTAGISSFYDLPLVNGLLSLVYMSLSTVVITEIFDLKKRLSIFLTGGILITFPSITAILAFNFTADGYFLAMLLATLAVFLTLRFRFGFLAGALCLCVSYGSYQAFVTFAIMLILLYLIQYILIKQTTLTALLQNIGRLLLMGIIGTLLYFVSLKVMLRVQDISLHNYQGISDMSIPSLSTLKSAAYLCIRQFYTFFLGSMEASWYTVLNLSVLLLLVIISVYFYIHKKLYKNLLQSLILFGSICAIPFAVSLIFFVSEGVWYHTLMCESYSLILVLPILFFDTIAISEKSIFHICYSWALSILLLLTIYTSALTANISYSYMYTSYEKSYALITRLADRIEQLTDDKASLSQLAVIGFLDDYDVYTNGYKMFYNPIQMTGVASDHVVGLPYDFTVMLNDYMNFHLTDAPDDVVIPFVHSEQYQNMECWPATSSIYIDGNTVYLKLSDVEW